MVRVQIPRIAAGFSRRKRPEERPGWFIDGSVDAPMEVYVVCANCGCPGRLPHEILADGTVNPSIWCKCPPSLKDEMVSDDWHVFGDLIGWDMGHRPRKPDAV